jgi:hypothetical protein
MDSYNLLKLIIIIFHSSIIIDELSSIMIFLRIGNFFHRFPELLVQAVHHQTVKRLK